MKITLVRHTSVDVPAGVCYGQSDVPLRSTFESEAAAVKAALEGRRFDIVFTSPLSRCVRLAQYCGYGSALRDERLMEINFGEWELRAWNDITDPQLQRWFDDYFHVVPTGGESCEQQQNRLADFFSFLKSTGAGNALLFTHGGIMAHTLMLAGRATVENAFSLQPPYGGIMEAEI